MCRLYVVSDMIVNVTLESNVKVENVLEIYLFWQKLFFHVVTKGVHIWHNDCLWFVD